MARWNSQELPESMPNSESEPQGKLEANSEADSNYKVTLVWESVIGAIWGHGAMLYGLFLMFTSAKIQTTLWTLLLVQLTSLGITAGAHRLWSHHSYKAKRPLEVMLIIFNSMAFQWSVYNWVRDHRVHHKFVDTNADPHNAKRGLFFSHIGWMLCRKHPDVKTKGRSVYMTDLDNNPIVQFQRRYYFWMTLLWAFIIPMIVPMYFWGETLNNAWHVSAIFRIALVVNLASLVNSAAHYWGDRPYDKNLTARDNPVAAVLTYGEAWHNYHHVFPWDYKTAELGNYRANVTTAFIDFFAKIGWAYDLKTVPLSLVYKRAQRTGESAQNRTSTGGVWGWGDKDMPKEDMEDAEMNGNRRWG